MKKLLRIIKRWKSKLFLWVYYHILPKIETAKANHRIKKLRRKKSAKGPIKVGFVVQMPEFWNKEAPVYERMTEDPRFDPWLIVVPAALLSRKECGEYGAELAFFQEKYPDAKMLTTAELSSDFSGLHRQAFEYIFFQRCWEAYLPEALRTYRVLPYAKTCYLPYAFHCFKPYPTYYRNRFFSSLYCMFCCSESQLQSYPVNGLRKASFLGFPCLSELKSAPERRGRVCLLWTPRWSSDPRYGGTTFFAYKDRFFELAKKHPELEIILRPHPLTFENAVKMGHMTPEEINAYKERCAAAGIRFDTNASIDDTLPEIDILLTDFSSIIVDAALAGKTILYCGGKALAEPDETMTAILACVYETESWEDVTGALERLLQQDDPMRDARMALSDRLTAEHQGSTDRILEYLAEDAGI